MNLQTLHDWANEHKIFSLMGEDLEQATWLTHWNEPLPELPEGRGAGGWGGCPPGSSLAAVSAGRGAVRVVACGVAVGARRGARWCAGGRRGTCLCRWSRGGFRRRRPG